MSMALRDVKVPAQETAQPSSAEEGDGAMAVPNPRIFSLRVVHLDYYMAAPLAGMDDSYSHFQGRSILEVPVVRIFGSTTAGQKTCLHLHKALPYFYVAYDEDLPQGLNDALAYVRRLASAVEKALKVASSLGAKRQHVHSCSLVRGRKYYGYYPNEQLFVKIVLYYPQEISRMSSLLLSGGIMNHKFQLYESHIPYLLQVLIDNNLYGMGHLHLSSLRCRNPLPGFSSDLESVIKNVKAEFLHKAVADPGQGASDPKDVEQSTEGKPEAEQPDPPSHLGPPQTTAQSPLTFPIGAEPNSSGSRQSTPVSATPPELWTLGKVPGQWMWPALGSSQSRYSKKTTCELEADASVQDVLNRGERLFRPLQETGPEVKMVQSLTSIWEEELRRSGESGPAGPVDSAQYQPTARTKPPASPLEKAMREALFQIAREDGHRVGTEDRRESTPETDAGGEENRRSEEEPRAATPKNVNPQTPAGQQTAAGSRVGSLLACTQAANGDSTFASPDLEFGPFSDGGNLGDLGSQEELNAPRGPEDAHIFGGNEKNDDDAFAVDQEAIEQHLTQGVQTQELENEAADFLRWLGATQGAEDDVNEDDGTREVVLSQMLNSPGMDDALLQALNEYENATERECQAILDCAAFDDDESDAQHFSNLPHEFHEDAPTSHINRGQASSTTTGRDNRRGGMFIPQTDGPLDDDDVLDKLDHDEVSSGTRKAKVNSDETFSSGSHVSEKRRNRQPGSSSAGASLREMMRKRRERLPQKREAVDSLSSISGDSANVLQKQTGQEKRESDQASGRGSGSRSRTALNITSKAGRGPGPRGGVPAATTGRVVLKSPDRERHTKASRPINTKNQLRKDNYAALPLVKFTNLGSKSEDAVVAVKRPRQEPPPSSGNDLTSRASGQAEFMKDDTEDTAHTSNRLRDIEKPINTNDPVVRIGGDDRDCGGGRRWMSNIPHSDRNQASASPHKKVQGKPSLNLRPYRLQPDKMEIDKDFKHELTSEDKGLFGGTSREVRSIHDKENALRSIAVGASQSYANETTLTTKTVSSSYPPSQGSPQIGESLEDDIDMRGPGQPPSSGGGLGDEVSGGLEDEAPAPSMAYHFTDISDDSQGTTNSEGSTLYKESKWRFGRSPLSESNSQEVSDEEDEPRLEPPEDASDEEVAEARTVVTSPPEMPIVGSAEPVVSSPESGKDGVAPSVSSKETPYLSSSIPRQSFPSQRVQSIENLEPQKSSFENEFEDSTANTFQDSFPGERVVAGGETEESQRIEDPLPSPSEYGAATQVRNPDDNLYMDADYLASQSQSFMPIVDRTGGEEAVTQTSPASHEDPKTIGETFALKFHRRPPAREQVLAECREHQLPDREEGGVYYGNVKDVPDHPAVMAGLIFDVKSKQPVHLRPFVFGRDGRRGKFEDGSRYRRYVQEDSWASHHDTDSVMGIPSHFGNDGTVTYTLTTARSPPTPSAVALWASSMQAAQLADASRSTDRSGGGQVFTMDANTGKLVPLLDIGKPGISQETLGSADTAQDESEFERPASPKYDERHVFNTSHHSPALYSKNFSPNTNLVATLQPKGPSRETSPNSFKETPKAESKRALLPCSTTKSADRPPLPPGDKSASCGPLTESFATKAEGNTVQDQQIKFSGLPPRASLQGSPQPVGKRDSKSPGQWRDISQITAIQASKTPTPLSQAGFQDPASSGGGQQVTLMSIEVFAETRGDLLPDPRYDAIGCIVLVIDEDGGKSGNVTFTVVLIRDQHAFQRARGLDAIRDCERIYLPDEVALIKCFTRLINLCDPDMLLGWEIQGYSLGLLAERAAILGISLLKQISRILPAAKPSDVPEKEGGAEEVADLFDKLPLEAKGGDEPVIEDEWGRTHGSGLNVGGRIVLNLWRIMRGEVKLGIYSLEAVAEAVLKRRVPRVPWRTLAKWFSLGAGGGRFRCLEYFIDRARLNLQIMEQLDLVNRTAELARVFGIDFYSVFSRGSQFRVESMMARLAHTQNYILVSPTRQQVAEQPAMACLPLVMEPESRFYTSPVIVLDFQSLYPSMIIAYNLCFSTCLGKLIADNPKVLGVTQFSAQPGLLDSLKECMTICPNGIMFAPAEVRPGVLPRLLQEILSTRIMVKKAMKKLPADQRVLQRVLNARQFALKLIANVTYGYTAAGFSGRMPCAEIADSIVQCGRLTLERAIQLVNSHPRWRARVVYGDTDSMFVLLEGRTREEAHIIGQEIAAAVTETNPPPIALKMEKVYHPCVLLTKKRYVGYSYESSTQAKPIFDAKGIETIRRDSCPAVAKALEFSLRTLFETKDLSQVKQYLQRQWGKILSGRVSLQDFIFAKEVRLGTYSARAPVLPPAAIVASKAMAMDPRAEPRYGERVPYVVVHGEPGARLVDMVVDPLALVGQPSMRLHDTYYITKQIIPACQRIFMLVGADLKAWFAEMPRVYRPPVSKRVSNLAVGTRSTKWDPEAAKQKRLGLKHGTIDQYYLSRHCTICGDSTRASQLLCGKCATNRQAAALLLPGRTARLEREYKHILAICRHCGAGDDTVANSANASGAIACVSLDCPVFFERRKLQRELEAAGAVATDLHHYPRLCF